MSILNNKKKVVLFSFTKLENRRAEQILSEGLVPVGGGGCRKRVSKGNMVQIHMYVNGKMKPVETVPGMVGRKIKENDGGGEFKYDILDIL
jgi:hypothetical protein